MNKLLVLILWAICGAWTWSQEISVTATGVEVGAVSSTASGALIQQSGQDTSFVVKDGVSPPSVKMVIKGDEPKGSGLQYSKK